MSYSFATCQMQQLSTAPSVISSQLSNVYSSTVMMGSSRFAVSPWKVGKKYREILDKIRLSKNGLTYDQISWELEGEADHFTLDHVLYYFCERIGSKYRLAALYDGSRYLSADGSHVLERGTLRF